MLGGYDRQGLKAGAQGRRLVCRSTFGIVAVFEKTKSGRNGSKLPPCSVPNAGDDDYLRATTAVGTYHEHGLPQRPNNKDQLPEVAP